MGIFSKLFSTPKSNTELSISKFNNTHNMEISSIKAAVAPMKEFKNGVEFTHEELMLGYMAHVIWFSGGMKFVLGDGGQNEDPIQKHEVYHFLASNTTARASAIYLMDIIQKYPSVITGIKDRNPSFDSERELVWAKLAQDPPAWMTSLTRSVIIISRGLAYQHGGKLSSPSPIIRGSKEDFCVMWASAYYGEENAVRVFDQANRFDIERLSWKIS